MAGLIVPPFDPEPWPTLGPQIVQLIEERGCFGPGDLRGDAAVVDDEKRALIYRGYEVYPKGHPKAGRRRFKRVCISLRKGTAKTELAAWIAFAELHPEGPVRCDGFDAAGNPVGRPVRDPYIPMVAYTEEQTEELAYGALYVVCGEGEDADLFDVGLERITRINGEGKAVALAAAPDSRDGARTTFQHFDEPHRMTSPRLVKAHQTMLANVPKRPLADPWTLSTTTAGVPGEKSVAEGEKNYAEKIAAGKARDPQMFFFHREAGPSHDLTTDEGLLAAITEASGPVVAAWSDLDSIAALYNQPDTDQAYWERVWLNRWVASSRQAFDPVRWKNDLVSAFEPPIEDPITIGFDGARFRDACGFIATHIETGFQWPLAYWENEDELEDWEVTDEQVDGALDEAMETRNVTLVYADPPRFEANVAKWSGKYDEKRVLEWYTNRPMQIGRAMRAFKTAQTTGALSHNGDDAYLRHIANARRGDLRLRDDDETPLWTIYKERPDSLKFIDLAMAGCLSWEARLNALAKGNWQTKKRSKKMIVLR